jgi:hypothetical protein
VEKWGSVWDPEMKDARAKAILGGFVVRREDVGREVGEKVGEGGDGVKDVGMGFGRRGGG